MIAAYSPLKGVSPSSVPSFSAQLFLPYPPSVLKLKSGANHFYRMEFFARIFRGYFSKETEERDVQIEPDAGGEDFYDAVDEPSPQHLVIMVNGIVGSAEDWKFAAEQFVKRFPDKVIVHRSECNYSKLTFDGVDLMGERLAEEVITVKGHWPEVEKISFVAHSLGGLIARYAIGRLYECDPKVECPSPNGSGCNGEQSKKPNGVRIAGLEPINFITVATPHLGSRGPKQLPLLCGLSFLEKSACQTAHLIVGRTGKHLFLTDNDDGRPPLLLRMVKDSDDLKFMSALHAFKRCVAYANANYDHMVGWRTSSIRRPHELPNPNAFVANEKYPHIVHVERERDESISNTETSESMEQIPEFEEEMIKGLTQLPWERVDVSFENSRQRYIAHSTIQVKHYLIHSDGADVIFHMIDNFLL